MNSRENDNHYSSIEVKKPKKLTEFERVAMALGYQKQPWKRSDVVSVFEKPTKSGVVYRFTIQNSKYGEQGVRIVIGARSTPEALKEFKGVNLCQDQPFNDDMKELGLVTRTSAKMFFRPEMTPEVRDKLVVYINNLEENGFFEDLLKDK